MAELIDSIPVGTAKLTLEILYHIGEGPDPSQRTEEDPMGDSRASRLMMQLDPEKARQFDEVLGRAWGFVVRLEDGEGSPTQHEWFLIPKTAKE